MTFAKRLKAAREKASKTQQDVANLFGIERESVAQWEADSGTMPSADKLARLAAMLKVSVDYLLSGKNGSSHQRGDSAVEQRGAARNVGVGPDIARHVPLISWVQAGKFEEAVNNLAPGDAVEWLPMPRRSGERTYALRVEGDSMTAPFGRSYPAGCIIFVDPDLRSPASGQRVIAKLEGADEVTFKVFVREAARVFLKPLNPQYPSIHDRFRIIGTVIGKWEDE